MRSKAFVQVYTGNGKGKTTAALGLTLRAVGAGHRVYIAQFVKGQRYSEIKSLEEYLPNVQVKQFGIKCFINDAPQQKDIDAALVGLQEVEKLMGTGNYDLIILDEANIAVYFKLFTVEQLMEVIDKRHPNTEVVITGRYATPEIVAYADLVTEMKEVKHYYKQGVQARTGIER